MDFATFFRNATRDEAHPHGRSPFRYQAHFADNSDLPDLVRAPTGAGKTATVVLGWLWRYFHRNDAPRRLVYCLPMRVLVEQTCREAKKWVKALQLDVRVRVLMGGEDAEEWDLNPEKPAVLIGTQDMLLSRALNRGYGMSRFRWPMHYALLNNDCLWVFDELQLMGSGVSTSAQLAGLRRALPTFGACPSVWMSATMDRSWLATVDHRAHVSGLRELRLTPAELTNGELGRRMRAKKVLCRAELSTDAGDKKGYGKAVAEAVASNFQGGSLTLVVLNTVDRAKAVFEALAKKKPDGDLLLLHSRFRPRERAQLVKRLTEMAATGGIVVATQVVEASVDISARALFTELAPWSSVVQRLGRCHRYGELTDRGQNGEAFWFDLPDEKLAPPYGADDLDLAREHLRDLEGQDVAPAELETYQERREIKLPFEHVHVVRRRDVIDLFDTSPDLSGNDIDVSRFVRGDDPETDVELFWREIDASAPAKDQDQPAPRRDELCPAPLWQVQDFLDGRGKGKGRVAYRWDHLADAWRPIRGPDLRPGLVLLIPASVGGYSWDPGRGLRSMGADPLLKGPASGGALTIKQHTEDVCTELGVLLSHFPTFPSAWRAHLQRAARWHDVGKGHWAFQKGVRRANEALRRDLLWAKSGGNGPLYHGRRYFRHELASTLAALQCGLPFEVAYLIATHHGKVRLSIRSLPGEEPPDDQEPRFALGAYQGDELPPVDLGGGAASPAVRLDLSPMQLGGEGSWSRHALALRDALGPFQLAFLETLLRVADMRASRKEARDG